MIDPTTNMLAPPPTSQSPGGAMTLEMAIRDWQQRLDAQAAEIERLKAKCDAWCKLVLDHNARCNDRCRNCRTDCPDCPADYCIAIPSEPELKP